MKRKNIGNEVVHGFVNASTADNFIRDIGWFVPMYTPQIPQRALQREHIIFKLQRIYHTLIDLSV